MLFADDTLILTPWVNLILQGGALGLLAWHLIWGLPKLMKDMNDNSFRAAQMAQQSSDSERKGFMDRTQLLIAELTAFRPLFPILGAKIDELKEQIENQSAVIRKWPSDPEKVGDACRSLEKLLERAESLVNILQKRKVS